jgi:futalosine hydrolase
MHDSAVAEPATLVIAATAPELDWARDVAATLACGVGPVEAAIVTAARLATDPPQRVVHVGLAGGSPPLGVVIGTRAIYHDLAAAIPVESVALPDANLLAAARTALPAAVAGDIATTAAVGSTGGPVEAMEGFAVLRACAHARVPAIEVRVISNPIGEADRAAWDIPGALAALAAAGRTLLAQIERASAS